VLEYVVCACSTNTKICVVSMVDVRKCYVQMSTDDQQFGRELVLKEARFDREFRQSLEASLLR
jgi:hypothetical protein